MVKSRMALVGRSLTLRHKDGSGELVYVKTQIDEKFAITNQGELVKVDVVSHECELIPQDEPLFLMRARDNLALDILNIYAMRSSGHTDFHVEGMRAKIAEFEKFQKDHPERMKEAGSTKGRL